MKPKRSFEILGVDGPRAFPTPDEIEWHLARSREIRAEATAVMFRSLRQAIARPFRRIGAANGGSGRQQRTSHA